MTLTDDCQFVLRVQCLEHGVPFLFVGLVLGDRGRGVRGSGAHRQRGSHGTGREGGRPSRPAGRLWAGDSIAAWSAQAPVRAPPQGATTVVTTAGTSGDIAGRVVGFCFIGSIIGHLLRGEKCSVHGAVHRDQASFRGTAAS